MPGLKILLVDDEDRLREVLRVMLESLGHEVQEARDGREALAVYAAHPAEVVLTDLYMPEKEGMETIRELRRRSPSLRIIAMSGGSPRAFMSTEDYLAMAQRMGANSVLAKPFTAAQLAGALDAGPKGAGV